METMAEINNTTRDEYGLKAAGILASLEKFRTLFGIKLGYVLFVAAEQVSMALQAKTLHFKKHCHQLTWLQHSIEDKGQLRLMINFMMA